MITLPPINLTGLPQSANLPGSLPGGTQIRFANESAYALQIGLGPETHWLNPWTVDVFQPVGTTTSVSILATVLTSSPLVTPSSVLLITMADPGERIPGHYPVTLDRQSSTYSQQVVLGSTGALAANADRTFQYTLPPGTHAVAITSTFGPGNIAQIIISGNVSRIYGNAFPQNPDPWPFYQPVLVVDTAIQFEVIMGAGGGITNIWFIALLNPQVVTVIPGRVPWGVNLIDASGQVVNIDVNGGVESLCVSERNARPAPWQGGMRDFEVAASQTTSVLLTATAPAASSIQNFVIDELDLEAMGGGGQAAAVSTWKVTDGTNTLAIGFLATSGAGLGMDRHLRYIQSKKLQGTPTVTIDPGVGFTSVNMRGRYL